MKNNSTVTSDLVMLFGQRDDGVIGLPCLTFDGRVIETSYFFGTKHPKNIVAISSQAGCPMQCVFCELGSQRFARNLTPEEMRDQVALALGEAKRQGFDQAGAPYKINVANCGEPLLNPLLVDGLELIGAAPKTVKVSTVFPFGEKIWSNFERLAEYASGLRGQVMQIQVSLISTDEATRAALVGGGAADFAKISAAGKYWRQKNPNGRKINLSLLIDEKTPCHPSAVAGVFPPEHFRLRFREYVPTQNGHRHALVAATQARLAAVMAEAAKAGYEVGDWASPTPVERRFGLAANTIRERYLNMVEGQKI